MNKIMRNTLLMLIVFLLIGGISAESLAMVSDAVLDRTIEDTAKFIHEKVSEPQVSSVGGEWAVIGLARSDYDLPDSYYEDYYKRVQSYVQSKDGKLHDKKYTEYSRLIISLTSIGKDPRDVGGYNLLTPLGDYEKTIFQGLNGPIWALISLDSGNYDMPVNPQAKIQASREMYIDRILESQLADGGWSLMGGTPFAKEDEKSDPDITGMALQALAKYQDMPRVKKATEESLRTLSKLQEEDGGFSSWGGKNLESNVQVIVALAELGIDLEDKRFIKNNNSLLDNLMSYYIENNGFVHSLEAQGSDQMASEQGFYALVAAKRLREGKSSLYRINRSKDREEEIKDPDQEEVKGLENKHRDIKWRPVAKPGISFEDIRGLEAGKREAIESLASRLIINGKNEKEFDPKGNMTRAEFAAIITRSLGIESRGENIFKDIKSSDWFYNYVLTANKYGIVNGVSQNEFQAHSTITKEEAGTMLARAGELAGMEVETNITTVRDILSQFEDYVTLSEWAMPSMAFLYKEEILDTSDMAINPKEIITRGEIAEIIYKMLGKANLL